MNCSQFMHDIPAFLSKDLDYDGLSQFCRHAEECDECREELTIQFLVSEGISHLEAGDAFDLNKELNARMQESRQALSVFDRNRTQASVLQLIGALFFVAAVAVILFS